MEYQLKLKIDDLPKRYNQISHGHWRKKQAEAKKWHLIMYYHCLRKTPPSPLLRARLVLTRHTSAQSDYDGLVSSWKYVIDGLVAAKILINDTPKVIGIPTYRWEKAPPKKGFITVEVYGVSDQAE